ncbi:MAG: hypothetical protein AAF514_20770 [Verrucomicrobiota bacterium]
MNSNPLLTQALYLGGVLHFIILVASASVPRVLDLRRNLAALHPFLRQLFWVYGVFIVLMIISFGLLTLAQAPTLAAGGGLSRCVCGMIAGFWGLRLAVQWFVFDVEPFLTHWFYRFGYHALTVIFVTLTGIFGWAALA